MPSVSAAPSSVTLKFWIPGRVTPKARPRVTRNGTYHLQQYQAWRNIAHVELFKQLEKLSAPNSMLPLQRVSVAVTLQGSHRGDADNLAGACLDALVEAGVLKDDRLSCLPELRVRHEPESRRLGVLVEVQPL